MAEILRRVAQDVTVDRELRKTVEVRATQIMNDAAKGLRQEFEKDPVTREIDGGIDAANISETLVGGTSTDQKNLASFIGFPDGTKPTDEIRKRLDPASSEGQGPKIASVTKIQDKIPRYVIKIRGPDTEAIYEATPLPWGDEGGDMSWVEGIETGIRGFNQFLNRKNPKDHSRSGGGIQVKKELRSAEFKPRPYLTRLFGEFKAYIETFTKQHYRQ